jgi:hypothetical protein
MLRRRRQALCLRCVADQSHRSALPAARSFAISRVDKCDGLAVRNFSQSIGSRHEPESASQRTGQRCLSISTDSRQRENFYHDPSGLARLVCPNFDDRYSYRLLKRNITVTFFNSTRLARAKITFPSSLPAKIGLHIPSSWVQACSRSHRQRRRPSARLPTI